MTKIPKIPKSHVSALDFRISYMSTFLVCVIIEFLVVQTNTKWINSFAGPYRIEVRQLMHCAENSDNSGTAQYYVRDSRTRHGQVLMYSGNLSMPFNMDDSLGGRLCFASWSSTAGWQDNAIILKFKKICSSLKIMVRSQWNLLMYSIFQEEIPCPVFAGIYRFENMVIDLRKIPIKQFPYGKWRVDSMVTSGSVVKGCLRIFADTLPLLN